MITTTQAIDQLIKQTPFLEQALSDRLINLSALARHLQPDIEKILHKPIQTSAITMALKRYADQLPTVTKSKQPNWTLNDLTLRSNLLEYTYSNSPQLKSAITQLMQSAHQQPRSLLTVTQGMHETTLILSQNLQSDCLRIFAAEHCRAFIDDLAAITIILPDNATELTGLHYHILKQLAWHDIPVVEEVSTYSEFTLILKDTHIDQAFSLLKPLTKNT